MKKVFLLFLLIPLLGTGQTTKTVLSTNRVFAKNDKVVQFEKALASHAQRFHKGDLSWRVWSIESGPDFGGYLIVEGPNTWDSLNSRGDISTAHTADWNNNIMPLTDGRAKGGYYVFQGDLSTVQLTDYADKIVINHVTANPGKIADVQELIRKLKKVWEGGKESVAVYSVASSGEPGYIAVTRLREGLKELATDYRKPLSVRFDETHGSGGFDTWLKDYAGAVKFRWTELLFFKPELSSK
ncbi:hypothetical protein L3C95_09860 [Chitinophaga filiformis]|uniref:hypothetical protein n=1 Tax=Chitinophaga filiformis TaxID=104663 RepID=UPI001F417850|nr:hypothetical protein [Chitinophaga filiformis]MCF6402902.1 hypothetical protein [Chitinophaga filiformis]MCF6403180.1 hypothetical protein [Chitinophaga filiformis]